LKKNGIASRKQQEEYIFKTSMKHQNSTPWVVAKRRHKVRRKLLTMEQLLKNKTCSRKSLSN
jgi:hypothetical protein